MIAAEVQYPKEIDAKICKNLTTKAYKWDRTCLELEAKNFCCCTIDAENSINQNRTNQWTTTEIHSSMPHQVRPGGPRS